MTAQQADKLIAAGKPVTLHNVVYGEVFVATIVRRDGAYLYLKHGEIIHRQDCAVFWHELHGTQQGERA